MDQERLQRIRNFQSTDWYPAIVIRPLSILVMLVIADWRFLTPNRLTTIANLAKLGACALIAWQPVPDDLSATVWAVVLLQLGIVFDHLDGTMARYRRAFTRLGSFYDKVSDLVTWFLIMLAIGWAAYRQTGDAHLLVLAIASSFALDVMGYMKWLATAESERLRWFEARSDPTVIEKRTAPIAIAPPPARTRADWLRWFARSWLQIVRFEEMDLFFWVGLGLLTGRLEWLIWLLFATQTTILLSMVYRRTRDIIRVDRRLRDLGDA
ncbi:MAG TPA: CDP-alcohol phosphatidyltransferase family protein [Kofleriaceae bacterium]|nr:CDP-alcohol phosphatidyltransferase family protein [Kofleriaceae bacterium]